MAQKPQLRPFPKIYLTTPEEPRESNRPKIAWRPILAIFSSAFLVWLLGFSALFGVKEIIIDGTPTEQTQRAIEELRGRNLIFWRLDRTQAELKKRQPGIAEIKIKRGLPQTIRVKLIERSPALVWQSQGKAFLVAADGVVIGETDPTQTALPKVVDPAGVSVELGKKLVAPDFVSFILKLKETFTQQTGLEILEASVGDTTFELSLATSAGFRAIFATDQPLEAQLSAFKEVLNSRRDEIREYVELRVPGKVYLK